MSAKTKRKLPVCLLVEREPYAVFANFFDL